jgi:alpha-glucosidase
MSGFRTHDPWLPISPDASRLNVEAETLEPASVLSLHRRSLDLRKRHFALSLGGYGTLLATGNILSYMRTAAHERFLIVLNLGSQAAEVSLASFDPIPKIILSTSPIWTRTR